MEQQQNQHHNPDHHQPPLESDSTVTLLENPSLSLPEQQQQQQSLSSDLGSAPTDPGEKLGDFILYEELQCSLDLKEGDSRSDVLERVKVASEVKDKDWVKNEREDARETGSEDEREKEGGLGGSEEREEREERGSYGSPVKEQTQYPVRPEAEDCSYYMKTGTCKFGSNCKFNHPVSRKSQNIKEKVKGNGESTDRPGQIECKYYLRSGGCKFGDDCRFNHTKGTSSTVPILELNFLGLPIRPGEKECPYYMRTGSCKYGAQCRFSHPDPTATGRLETMGFANGSAVSLQGASQATLASWSSPGAINEPTTFLPMMFPPTAGVPSQNPELNGYPAVYPPERGMHPPPGYLMNSLKESNVFAHKQQQQQTLVEEFPERPGHPECSYYLKTGDCKFKSNCKYHHPKNRISRLPPCALSDKGLPLRPGQSVCTYYSRYGICKYGPACKFDHPINQTPNASEVDSASAFSNATTDGVNVVRSGNEMEAATQHPV